LNGIFLIDDASPYQQLWDYQGGDQPIYQGWATPGVPASANQWRIKKYGYTTVMISGNPVSVLTQVQFANGDVGFHAVWNASVTTVPVPNGTSYTGGATFQ
jgi:hypothetical protein